MGLVCIVDEAMNNNEFMEILILDGACIVIAAAFYFVCVVNGVCMLYACMRGQAAWGISVEVEVEVEVIYRHVSTCLHSSGRGVLSCVRCGGYPIPRRE